MSGADGLSRHSGTGKGGQNSLPPLSAAGVVQVPCPYSVSGADGLSRHSGVGKTSVVLGVWGIFFFLPGLFPGVLFSCEPPRI